MKTILLMTDFSENARNAIRYAISAFGQEMNYLLLNSFIVRDSTSVGPLAEMNYLRKSSEDDLGKELAFIKKEFPEYPNLRIKPISEFGEPHTALERAGAQSPIDLVIMGTKGASGLNRIFVGTVTASVIRNTSFPVLAIPENAQFAALDKIAFACDLHKDKDEAMVMPLRGIAERFNSEVMLVNISSKGGSQRIEELKRSGYLEGLKRSWHGIVAGDVSGAIDQFCEEKKIDLLVVVARHNRFFDRIFHRSITQQLIYQSKLPILVLDAS